MKITQFKKMLSIHGSDFSRWDDVKPDEAKTFMESSPQAQNLYKEALALDNALDELGVPAADPAILTKVMKRMGVTPEETATVHKLPPRKKMFMPRPVVWGGAAMAMAAAVILFVTALSAPDIMVTPQQNMVTAAAQKQAQPDTDIQEADVQIVLAEIDAFAEEEIARREIMGLWRMADASAAPTTQPDDDVDVFLDELFPAAEETQQKQQNEPDLWELFLQAEQETQEL